MKLLTYKIIGIEGSDLTIEFTFNTGKENHTISFKDMDFHDSRVEQVKEIFEDPKLDEKGEPIVDEEGNALIELKSRVVDKVVGFVNTKPRFNIKDKEVLDAEIKEFAQAYIQGKAHEEAEKKRLEPSDEIKSLIGQSQEVV